MSKDYTLTDIGRRNFSLTDTHRVTDVLPDHFAADYPKLVKLLEKYFDIEDSDISPSRLVHNLIDSRDITTVDETLLSFIEDELLLGQSYFEGFQNKRQAAKLSNTLYKSKGTLFSIQQFFRAFYGVDPDVQYTKDNVFIVGEDASKIGFNSQKYITDDKLYQIYAILIKVGLPISQWREAYKLFVHPAGMYVGGEVQIESKIDPFMSINQVDYEKSTVNPIIETISTLSTYAPVTDLTGEEFLDRRNPGDRFRMDLPTQVDTYQDLTVEELNRGSLTIQGLISPDAVTFDIDSADNDIRFDQDEVRFDTFDEVNYVWYDSDSA